MNYWYRFERTFLPFAVLIFLISALVWSIREAPTANPEFRLVNARGDWLVSHAPALFDYPRYAYEIGQSHLRNFFESGDVEGLPAALSAFRLAVASAPADAFAWAALAWAEAGRSAVERGLNALEASWRFAPYSHALAFDRASLVQSNALGSELVDTLGHRRDFSVLELRGLSDAFDEDGSGDS